MIDFFLKAMGVVYAFQFFSKKDCECKELPNETKNEPPPKGESQTEPDEGEGALGDLSTPPPKAVARPASIPGLEPL